MGIERMAVTTAFKKIDEQMPKVITPRGHGVIDYAMAGAFLIGAWRMWESEKRAAVASLVTGGLLLTEALLTDYPLGVKPMLSFEVHGQIDHAFMPVALAIPQTFAFKSKGAMWFFRINAIAAGLVVSMTNFNANASARQPVIPIDRQQPAAS